MKLIAFDLDETLLRSDKTVSDFTVATLRHMRKIGNITVVNTARSEIFTAELPLVPESDYYIYNGGSLIKDSCGNTVFRDEIPKETVKKMLADFALLTEEYSVQTDEALFTSGSRLSRGEARTFDFVGCEFPYPALKMLAAIDSDDEARAIAERHGVEMTTYVGGRWRRFNTLGTGKLSAIKNLCNIIGVSLSDCIFFGDDFGDLDAIDAVGIGVLMKNAAPVHHTKGRIISKYTNNEDGVARFLEEYFAKNV